MLRPASEIQAAFAAALLDPDRPVPPGVLGRAARSDTRRFAVYRNNIVVGLTEALGARFPVTRRLVGEAFFAAMARVYVGEKKPQSPLMMRYGDDFPEFIAGFAPANSVPYLADVTRLERAWSESYHAAEATPLTPDALAADGAMTLATTRATLHPSLRLLRSAYPIATIWAAHQTSGEVTPPERWAPEHVLVLRPHAEVVVHRLPPGGGGFIEAVQAGGTLEEAVLIARAECADFDIAVHLVGLFDLGAVIALDAEPAPCDEEQAT